MIMEDMEIANYGVIAALLQTVQERGPKPAPEPALESNKRRGVRSTCSCHNCATCADNARWNRVFNEKFADPTYYQPRLMKRGSSLGAL